MGPVAPPDDEACERGALSLGTGSVVRRSNRPPSLMADTMEVHVGWVNHREVFVDYSDEQMLSICSASALTWYSALDHPNWSPRDRLRLG